MVITRSFEDQAYKTKEPSNRQKSKEQNNVRSKVSLINNAYEQIIYMNEEEPDLSTFEKFNYIFNCL